MTEQKLEKAGKRGYSSQQRQDILQQWSASNKNKRDFCQEAGINYYTLMSWLGPEKKRRTKSIKQDQPDKQFSEIRLESKATVNLFARITQGKIVVDLFQPVNPEFFRQLFHA